MDVTEEFMKNLFAAQEVQWKKENQDFKDEIKVMMSEVIKLEVEKATKPLKESQEKMIQEQADLIKTVEVLAKKVVDIENGKEKNSEFPRMEKPRESEVGMDKITVKRRVESEDLTKDQKAVRGLFKMSNLTIGLSPISKEFIEAEVSKQTEDEEADKEIIRAKVIKEALKEFMVMEMKVKEEHFHKLNIVRTFTPQKSDWQIVYVELESEDQVDWIMSHTRWIPEQEKGQIQTKVVKYVPRQLFNRWNAIQAEAFKIRKESNWRTQTKVGQGKDDFFLQTRAKGERLWNTNLLPADLPKVELEFLSREERSPPGSPGVGIINPRMFNHLDAALVSTRRK